MSRLTSVLKSVQQNNPKAFFSQTYKLYEASFTFLDKAGSSHQASQARFALQGGWSAVNDYMKMLLSLMNEESKEHGAWSLESLKALDQEVFCIGHEMVNLARKQVDTRRVFPWEIQQRPDGLKEMFHPGHLVNVFTNVHGEDWVAYVHREDFSVSFTSCDLDYNWQKIQSLAEVTVLLNEEERKWLALVLETASLFKIMHKRDSSGAAVGATIQLTPDYALSFLDSYIRQEMKPDNFYGLIERKIRCESLVAAFSVMGVLLNEDAVKVYQRLDELAGKLENQRQKRRLLEQAGGVQPGDWGSVEIVKGKFKGETGEYDDDDEGRAVVILSHGVELIPYKYLTKLEEEV